MKACLFYADKTILSVENITGSTWDQCYHLQADEACHYLYFRDFMLSQLETFKSIPQRKEEMGCQLEIFLNGVR